MATRKKAPEQKNVLDLRNDMLSLFEQVKEGNVDLKTARTLTSISEQIIVSAKTELAQRKFLNEQKPIPFLDTKRAK